MSGVLVKVGEGVGVKVAVFVNDAIAFAVAVSQAVLVCATKSSMLNTVFVGVFVGVGLLVTDGVSVAELCIAMAVWAANVLVKAAATCGAVVALGVLVDVAPF